MTKSIQEVLSPLLIISYICGLRIIKFPENNIRQWFSFLYILVLWSFWTFIAISSLSYMRQYSIEYFVCIGMHTITVMTSIALGMYYDKVFRNCIKNLIIVDDTLEELGTTTNYYKFKMKVIWYILGCFVTILLLSSLETYFLKANMNTTAAVLIPFTRNYYAYINFIGDLLNVIILRYIGLKFNQINEYIEALLKSNKHRIKLTWKHSCKSRFPKVLRNKCLTKFNEILIIMHLHLELCKISRKIDSIFGIQMTLEIGCYFTLILSISKEIFIIIFDKNHANNNQMLYITLLLIWLFIYIIRLYSFIYVCENISNKANTTGNFINRFSYITCNVEIRENILQSILQIAQSPLKFYGLGLFQFDFKFLYGFFASVLTVLVIYTQAFTNNKHLN